MYSAPPSAKQLENWGLLPSDIPAVTVFEENWAPLNLMVYMATQWNVGMGGAFGLKYEIAHHKLDRANLDPEEYEQRMDDLRVMERAALAAMRKQQEEA